MRIKSCLPIIGFLVIAAVGTVSAGTPCNGINFKTTRVDPLNTSLVNPYFADLDGDGVRDLMGQVNYGYGFAFYKGTPAGFVGAPLITEDGDHYKLQYGKDLFADFNGDGFLDMVGQKWPSNEYIAIYLNNGHGQFTRSTVTETNGIPGENSEFIVASVDFNGDGRPDLLTKDGFVSSYGLYLRLQNADHTFGSPTNTFVSDFQNLIIHDFNGDGRPDLSSTMAISPYIFATAINQGNGTFTEGGRVTLPHDYTHYGDDTMIEADIDGDGRAEIVSGTYPSNDFQHHYFSVFSISPTGAVTQTERDVSSLSTDSHMRVRWADFDGDGTNELMFFAFGTGLLAKPAGGLNFTVSKTGWATDDAPIVRDQNGDGRADLMFVNHSSLLGSNIESVSYARNMCGPVGQTRTVDFNGDGVSDIVFWRPSDGAWRIYGVTNEVHWGSGALGDIPVPQDYDGDGLTDYAVFRAPTGYWYISRSSDGQTVILPFGIAGDKPVPADFDGDGQADLAVYRPSEGYWYYQPSTAPQKLLGYRWGIAEDIPLPMDYNADGSADLAVYRPSNGAWYIWRTNGEGYSAVTFGGVTGDRPVPGDYDRDGRADYAIFRQNPTQFGQDWYIAPAHNLYTFAIAVNGDIPFTVAWRGSAVPAAFRPSTSSLVGGAGAFPFPGNAGNRNASWILPVE